MGWDVCMFMCVGKYVGVGECIECVGVCVYGAVCVWLYMYPSTSVCLASVSERDHG